MPLSCYKHVDIIESTCVSQLTLICGSTCIIKW